MEHSILKKETTHIKCQYLSLSKTTLAACMLVSFRFTVISFISCGWLKWFLLPSITNVNLYENWHNDIMHLSCANNSELC